MADLDPDISIIYAATRSLIKRNDVRICASEKHNRSPIPDAGLAAKLDDTWNDRIRENPRLWNGTKFRVAGVESDSKTLTLHIGITCYKDFLSTNWAPYATDLKSLGRQNSNNAQEYLSDAMGVGALVVSKDGKVILLRRSHHVAEAAGSWDVPGGHCEPERLVGNKEMDEIHPDELVEAEIIDEIFDSIIREINDEVNIPMAALSEPSIMGVAGNNHSAGRPSIEFLVRCSMTSEEIIRRYYLGNQAEADESTSIVMLDVNDVLKLQDSDVWCKLAPSAKGCFHLYQITCSGGVLSNIS